MKRINIPEEKDDDILETFDKYETKLNKKSR